jgi:hypothetical protein
MVTVDAVSTVMLPEIATTPLATKNGCPKLFCEFCAFALTLAFPLNVV